MCQLPQARWSTIETSAGVYSSTALANLDSIITFQRQNGASVYFGMYGTPTFYAQTAANPTVGDNTVAGPWGALGEASYPSSLAAVTNFVNLLINRYNKAGGTWYDANFATLGKGIQSWETWNEPSMGAAGNGASSFWWGTAAQMVDMAQTQYAAVKAADATIKVTSPGFTGTTTPMSTFLSTTGPVTVKTGLQSCEALAFHPYQHNPFGVVNGIWTNDVVTGPQGIRVVKRMLADNGWSLPLWISEVGVDASGTSQTVRDWYAASASYRYTWWVRLYMYWAGEGVQVVCPWHWQEQSSIQGNSGNWHDDINGVTKAANDVAAKVSGKTIIGPNSTYKQQGPVTLNFSDGTSWSV